MRHDLDAYMKASGVDLFEMVRDQTTPDAFIYAPQIMLTPDAVDRRH